MIELDILGEQLMLALRFQESGFDPALELQDEVESETVKAHDLFSNTDGRWFMRGSSIPGHVGIKMIGVDGDSLYLETSPLKPAEIRQAIVERMLPFEYREEGEGSQLVDTTTNTVLVKIGPVVKPEIEGLGLRCLWTFPLASMNGIRRQAAIRMADVVFSIDAYEVEADEAVDRGPVNSAAAVQRLSQQLQIGLQQRLQFEQRPVLSLTMRPEGALLQTQELELQQIMTLNRRLLTMRPEELPTFFEDFIVRHGEKAALRVAIFAVAGKVKSARPEMSWKEARRLARRLMVA